MFRFVVARFRFDACVLCATSARNFSCLAVERSRCLKKSAPAPCHSVYTVRDFSLQSWAQTLSQSTPVAYAQDLLEAAHSTSGLSWGSTIVLTSLALRVAVTLPLAVYQHHVLARFANLDREMAGIAQELKRETMQATRMFNLTEKQARHLYRRNLKRHLQRLVVRDNCHPMKSAIVVLFQLPMWISLSVALRNMAFMLPYQDMGAQATYLELSFGGLLWFTNLTQPDPLHVIPLLVGFTNLMNVEFHVLQRQKHMASLRRWITNFARGVAVVSVPIAWIMPANVSLYWLCSSSFALGQNMLMAAPRFRRACSIPVTASESQTPFKDVANRLRQRLDAAFRTGS
ncbi:cytochrome c oxidase assembly protein COX18, mitochondrial [Rhipicephalus sanguineus]|uniref:cytochrome c oxidase assembly protein COX18, mitochondrial n=1 Tax=Rhipicephalus sanguineus TaxID=34632 RepID=UPI001892E0EB|nr:cytochrome c oxidase assembly protein COX18, mitochondrial [Rhipicephalus sanguineus]